MFACPDQIGDVAAVDEDAAGRLAAVADRLEDEIDEAFLFLRVRATAEHDAHSATDEGFAAVEDAVEQVDEALRLNLGQRLADRLADNFAVADKLAVGGIGEFIGVAGLAQNRHETGRLVEQMAETVREINLMGQPGFCPSPRASFPCRSRAGRRQDPCRQRSATRKR